MENHPGRSFHFYAVDMRLYFDLTHKNVTQTFDQPKNCLDDIKKWLSANELKLNPDITKFMYGSRTVHGKTQ